ncbi:MAG: cache domain-containing protein [Bacteroidales bacterium]
MKIKTKLPLYTSITVLFSITFIAAFSIISFRNRTLQNIENYRKEELAQIQQNLKDMVNMSYNMIAQSYEKQSAKSIQETYGISLNETDDIGIKMLITNILNITVENLRVLSYGVDGYIWINKIDPPYEVVMHATRPDLEGEGQVFIIPGTNTNVYERFAEICNEQGEGYLEYSFYKPGQNEMLPKLSFIKLFKPLGWVIGTGVYIDNVEKEVKKKTGELENQITNLIYLTILIGIVLVAIASLILYYLGLNITNAISQVSDQLLEMAKGHRVSKLEIERRDEIGEMSRSLDILIDGVSSYGEFAVQIGKGNLDAQFSTLSEGDELGNSLLEMRQSLKAARKEEEIRQAENRQRSWMAEGQTLISEVMRTTGEDLKTISHRIISSLIRYLDANQGGIFILNDDDPKDIHIELMASFAYNRSRFHQKRIKPGDGIIGACFLEKEKIFMTKVPEDYMQIRSGLGTSNPTCLLVVPLKTEDNVIGVIEVASFNILQKHEIEFVEKVSENISSSLFTSKANRKTEQLLQMFRKQAEEKAAQEAEMRHNIEELEMLRRKLTEEQQLHN